MGSFKKAGFKHFYKASRLDSSSPPALNDLQNWWHIQGVSSNLLWEHLWSKACHHSNYCFDLSFPSPSLLLQCAWRYLKKECSCQNNFQIRTSWVIIAFSHLTTDLSQPGLVKVIWLFTKPCMWLILNKPPGREQLNSHWKASVLKIWSSFPSSSPSPVQLSRTETSEELLVVYLGSSPAHLCASNSHCFWTGEEKPGSFLSAPLVCTNRVSNAFLPAPYLIQCLQRAVRSLHRRWQEYKVIICKQPIDVSPEQPNSCNTKSLPMFHLINSTLKQHFI